MTDIVLRDIEKWFGDSYVIRKLNLEIRDREFVVLLGPSGCGKTTTLRAIAGLEEIDDGDILIDGSPVQHRRPADRDIAFVFQLFALYPHLTAYENIAFPLRAIRVSRADVDARVRAVAHAIGIEHILDRKPSALSGGDMQRIAIGRALVRRPKAMLMDEPIGALDAQLRESMRTELKRLHIENGSTTIYVTHDQIEAMSLADRIAVMNEGVLQQVGTPTAVYQKPANLFVAQFIGSPVMNVLPARVRSEGERSTLLLADAEGAFDFAGPLPRRSAEAEDGLMVGIRAEAVRVAVAPSAGFTPIEAHIIEPLGAYDIVDLKVGGQFLRARTASGFVEKPGQTVWVRLDEGQTHFFGARSGSALRAEPGG
ncbi:MAG: ABC transporter ATP-binding protein [Xanthobacteraceae bacterium]